MKIAIILGTRPEIIKMSPIIRQCEKQGIDYYILHTGQHYSYEMDKIFFEQLKLPQAKYNLDAGSGKRREQNGRQCNISSVKSQISRSYLVENSISGDQFSHNTQKLDFKFTAN